MNLKELQEVVAQGEGQQIEFKLKATFPDKIAREIVAFANSNGGQGFIGVDDRGVISGLKFADEEQYEIEQAIRRHIRPTIKYRVEQVPISKKKAILYLKIFEQRRKPVFFLEDPDTSQRGFAFIRHRDKSIKASREMVQIMRRSRSKKSYPVVLGNTERLLFQVLAQHGRATVHDLIKFTGLPNHTLSRKLIDLVLCNILQIDFDEKADFYSIKSTELTTK